MFKNMRLVICRHGESIMNYQNKFSGWIDTPLSKNGIYQSFIIAEKIQRHNLIPHTMYTSNLLRTTQSAEIIKNYLKYEYDIKTSWRLNPRHFGFLEGMSKEDAFNTYGKENVSKICTDYLTMPYIFNGTPVSDKNILVNNDSDTIIGESNNMVNRRVIPLWENKLKIELKENKTLMIMSHKDILTYLTCIIEKIDIKDSQNINIEHGNPIYYELDDHFNILNKKEL